MKLRLEISFILKDKTREDVNLQDHLVQTKQELKSTRKLLNQKWRLLRIKFNRARVTRASKRRNQQRRRGKGKMDQPNT